MIRFLIKCGLFAVFVLVIISLFAPRPPNSTNREQTENSEKTSTVDAVVAVKDTIGDLSGFCQRNVKTCETGRALFESIGTRMRDGAKIAYQYLDARFGQSQDRKESSPALTINHKTDNVDSQSGIDSPMNFTAKEHFAK